MKNGIFFYSPYPDLINDGTYNNACLRLNQDKDTICEVIVKMEDLNDKINNDFYNFDKVLLISHISFNCDEVEKFGDNVYFYSAMTLNKNVMLDFLESNGIPITPYVYQPKNKDEIFKKLGERVVIKPNEYTSHRGHLIKEISYDNCPENLDRWLFTKFIGKSDFPRVFRRVTCLFGESIFYYEAHHNDKHSWFNDCNSGVIDGNIKGAIFKKLNNKNTMNMAKKVSVLMSEYFGSGMVGCDFIVDDKDDVFLCEANTGVISIVNINRLEELDDRINCGKSIYKSCRNILNAS
jgi:hypothetical protein